LSGKVVDADCRAKKEDNRFLNENLIFEPMQSSERHWLQSFES